MDYRWCSDSNFFCWMAGGMGDIYMLDNNKKCWEKVFVWDKFKNRVISIR